MQPKKIRWRMTIIPGIGAILAVLGAALAICWDDIFHSILSKELRVTPGSRSYDVWKETPVTLFFDFYFFNWTNPEDITDKSTKPNFVELGPYRFRETRQKVNITFNPENSTVSYKQLRRWYFDADGSNGTLEDEINTLNVVAASAIYTSRFWSYIRQKGVSIGLTMFHEKIYVTKTIGELLFDGYNDPLLDLAKSMPGIETNAPPVDKFGWFYQRNGSTENDGYFNMATGEANISMIGQALQWNHDSRTKFFPGECAEVKGSAGEFYPPKQSMNNKLTMFSPDLCRTISFDFDEVVDVKGISAYKYLGGSSILDNGTILEENKCFCIGECQPSGTLNVSTCRYGSPAFISFPHFYLADPYYLNAVEGLSPDKDKHSFFLSLEPTSGIPVDVAARFQLNIFISPSTMIDLYKKVPKMFVPILWFEQCVTLDDKFSGDIKTMILVPLIGKIVSFTIFVFGIFIILWTPLKINIRSCLKKKKGVEDKEIDKSMMNNIREAKECVKLMPTIENDISPKNLNDEEAAAEPLTSHNDLTKE